MDGASMTDICLIHPFAHALANRTAYPPLGLLYVAAALEANGHEVSYVDYNIDQHAQLPDADIYGVQLHAVSTYHEVRRILTQIRADHTDALTVVGGPGTNTELVDPLLKDGLANLVVIGPGEETMCELAATFDQSAWRTIPGIKYYSSRPITTPPRQLRTPYELPFPARHLYPRELLRDTSGVHGPVGVPATTLISTRGCVFNCAFCETHGAMHGYVARSPVNVIRELEHLQAKYEIYHYRFVDDIFTYNAPRTIALCDLLSEQDITFICITHSGLLSTRVINSLKRAGCLEVMLGIESGSPRMLKRMNKRQSLSYAAKVIRWLRDADIASKLFIMVCFPGENAETIAETKAFLERTQPDKVHLSCFIPLPGSDVWLHPEKYKIDGLNSNQLFDESWFYWDDPDSTKGIMAVPRGTTVEELAALRADLMRYVKEEAWKKHG